MKRIVSILLAISIMITIGAPMTFADGNTTLGTITVGTAEVEQGEGTTTAKVPVKFEGSVMITSLLFDVNFGSEIGVLSFEKGTISVSQAPQKDVPIAGFILYYNDPSELGNGTFGTIEFTVPIGTVKNYELTVDIIEAMDENYDYIDTSKFQTVDGEIRVVPPSSDPEITFKDGSGAEVNKVVEGTMELTVDLNGADYDLVLFAIYSTGTHPYVEMKYVETATLSDGVYKATITNIEIESDKDYYAKAFVWNTSDYLGICETISENN